MSGLSFGELKCLFKSPSRSLGGFSTITEACVFVGIPRGLTRLAPAGALPAHSPARQGGAQHVEQYRTSLPIGDGDGNGDGPTLTVGTTHIHHSTALARLRQGFGVAGGLGWVPAVELGMGGLLGNPSTKLRVNSLTSVCLNCLNQDASSRTPLKGRSRCRSQIS